MTQISASGTMMNRSASTASTEETVARTTLQSMQTVDDVDTGPMPAVGRHPGRLRDRILPRSVLGLSALILAAALGAAFSGTVLYRYYDYRLNKAQPAPNPFKANFSKEFKAPQDQIKARREDAKAQVRKELEPLQK